MARIPVTTGFCLTLFLFSLILPACQSRQDAGEKTDEKTTSWRATPKLPIIDEAEPPENSDNIGKVEAQPNPPVAKAHPSPIVKSPPVTKPHKTEPPPSPPPPPPATMPKVGLTEKLRATCLVNVNDAFPEGQLTDLSGKTQNLADVYGKRLTVVFLWSNGKTDYSRAAMDAALRDLQLDVLDHYQQDGLRVAGVNVSDPAETVKSQVEKAGVKFPVLLDPRGDFFKTVATQELPRVYLLDAAGNVLWFDIDLTYITRQNLAEAIQAVLESKP
ncbi:MAG: TlpA family protein disulfide reductase [Pirellulales bacterium]|nr:TlpA family protein disulfide reductase [Pirellulales bacterium]